MSLSGEIQEITIKVECDNCGSEDECMNFDPFNQDMEETLKDHVAEGWLFMMDARWGKKDSCPTIWRQLFCFCDQGCFDEYLKKEKETKELYIPAGDDLGYWEAHFDENVEVTR